MPNFYPKYFLLSLLVCCCISLSSPSLALANTDPQSSTPSATATVPQTQATDVDAVAPTIPILIRPIDGWATADPHPEFVWRRSTDPNGNSLTYTLYLNGVASYLGISNIGNSTSASFTAVIEDQEVKLLPVEALADGEYSWYVTASDISGNTSHSTTWNFTIDTHPPLLTLTDLDTHHDLTLDSDHPEEFVGLQFELSGPKDIYFTFLTEASSTLVLQFLDSDNQLVFQSSSPVGASGRVYPYQHLSLGRYSVIASAVDRAQNTVALPSFTLNITQAQITVPIPNLPGLPGLPDSLNLPYTPLNLPTLPATISLVTTRPIMAIIIMSLLAIAILYLLIVLWKRRYNIIFLDNQLQPLTNTIVYHSLPTTSRSSSHILVTTRDPLSFSLTTKDHGRLYIPHLTRYSTLTVRSQTATYVLSLSAKRRLYTLILG